MKTSILDKIIANKKIEIANISTKFEYKNIKKSTRNLLKVLQKKKYNESPKLIAEIKKASPSQGIIYPDANIIQIAKIYEENKATAISVLTDEKFFNGKLEDLEQISKAVNIPIIRKDFILCSEQISEARIYGADAVLLMVSVLHSVEVLRELREYAESFDMHCLVETHSEEEIEIAIKSGAKIIGVNSRDFSNLSIDKNIFSKLLPLIPANCVAVAESGITNREDINKIKNFCDAILVGTILMKKQILGIPEKMREFIK